MSYGLRYRTLKRRTACPEPDVLKKLLDRLFPRHFHYCDYRESAADDRCGNQWECRGLLCGRRRESLCPGCTDEAARAGMARQGRVA